MTTMDESTMALLAVVGRMVEVLTPEQARQVASKVRAIPGDDIAARFYLSTADALDRLADEKEAEA
jgi:hypothetical protein